MLLGLTAIFEDSSPVSEVLGEDLAAIAAAAAAAASAEAEARCRFRMAWNSSKVMDTIVRLLHCSSGCLRGSRLPKLTTKCRLCMYGYNIPMHSATVAAISQRSLFSESSGGRRSSLNGLESAVLSCSPYVFQQQRERYYYTMADLRYPCPTYILQLLGTRARAQGSRLLKVAPRIRGCQDRIFFEHKIGTKKNVRFVD